MMKTVMVMLLCRDFFGISSDFVVGQLMTRGGEKASLFYVTPTLKHLIECNQTAVNVSIFFCVVLAPPPTTIIIINK